jgi:zinc D-Ala-D-Ala carboxypeptidase
MTPYFTAEEFRCPCGCGTENVSKDLMDRLERLRGEFGHPLIVNSGCRCPAHNAHIGGVKDSAHVATDTEPCEAADLRVLSGSDSYRLLDIILFMKLFNRIGIGKSLIHVDVDAGKPQNTIWIYSDK